MFSQSKQEPLTLAPEHQESGGNFFSGLIVGAALGACSLFFFNSKNGKKTLKNLKKEWEDVKQDFRDEFGGIEDKPLVELAKEGLFLVERRLHGEELKAAPKEKPHRPAHKKGFFFTSKTS